MNSESSLWPFLVLFLAMGFVILAIAVFRLHPFPSLMAAALLVGLLASSLPGTGSSHILRAFTLPLAELWNTATKIAWVIAMASIIGVCLMESGAADQIVRRLVRLFGEAYAGWAMLASGFLLGIPVFFDTVFFLLIPLAQALSLRLGGRYVLFVTALSGGAAITHTLVPPTPGPLLVVETLGLNLGFALIIGLAAGLFPAVVVSMFGRWLDSRLGIRLRERPGLSLTELRVISSKPAGELPPFGASILPLALPVILIAAGSCGSLIWASSHGISLGGIVKVLGDKNLAMFLGALISLILLSKQKSMGLFPLARTLGKPLATAMVIILITSAGGAFGAMIKNAGVGEAVQEVVKGTGISLILLAWLIASVMKLAQGSGTVSMITTAGMMAAILARGTLLECDPLYIYLAIGFGSLMGSWMNDSGFWVVCKLAGYTEKETLRTWTASLALIATAGLIQVLVFSHFVPFPFGARSH